MRRERTAPWARTKERASGKVDRATLAAEPKELDSLIEDAIVDAYGDDEQRVGFLTALQDRLDLPFDVRILGVGARVERIDEIDDQIVAICRAGRYRQLIPILELPLPDPPPRGAEWIEAYRRFLRER